jgi:hypothetical protein
MSVSTIVETNRGAIYVMEVDGLAVAEVDILRLDDERRIVTYRPLASSQSWGTVPAEDSRTDEELAKDTFFVRKVSMKAPSFRRKAF